MQHSLSVAVGLAVVSCLSMNAACAQADQPGPLRVGLATADITPEGPVWMRGFGARKKPSEGVYRKILTTA